jgi:hypothetical protein
MAKKSSLSQPLWRNKNTSDKLHPVTIKHFISLKMIIAFIYENTTYNVELEQYQVSNQIKELKNFHSDFLKKLKDELRWEGIRYFENIIDEMDKDTDRYNVAENFAKKKFTKWFNENALNFIIEE